MKTLNTIFTGLNSKEIEDMKGYLFLSSAVAKAEKVTKVNSSIHVEYIDTIDSKREFTINANEIIGAKKKWLDRIFSSVKEKKLFAFYSKRNYLFDYGALHIGIKTPAFHTQTLLIKLRELMWFNDALEYIIVAEKEFKKAGKKFIDIFIIDHEKSCSLFEPNSILIIFGTDLTVEYDKSATDFKKEDITYSFLRNKVREEIKKLKKVIKGREDFPVHLYPLNYLVD